MGVFYAAAVVQITAMSLRLLEEEGNAGSVSSKSQKNIVL